MSVKGVRKPIEHGTHNGYFAHIRRNEVACFACLEARRVHYWQRLGRAEPEPREISPHGTNARYETHRRRGEPPCDACKDAHARMGRVKRQTQDSAKPFRRRPQRRVILSPPLFAELYWTASPKALEMLDAHLGADEVDRLIKLSEEMD